MEKEKYEIKNKVEQWGVWKQENKWAYLWLVMTAWVGGFLIGLLLEKFGVL